ncbi:patatin-like phospholipase family protein [Streptomyces scopuliridis]|uniref:Patatin-like phospholipase family protein n=1 Tax=Streptomyces scopuliridis TaxID=452529 RepID=A0ACD4ZSI3_9ACTN|nr:patatin-like phospholipase family protein [Streptomyces scopuliridis]WSB37029.1 patatin-like phospholipase family protein [Streptomyces scopuliridis]WSC01425.1 patatin-like phospholipase family protein [Streptomyces scopuliridis]WSC05038.1 patatin-like phospholipase family protein [Streptomyces scopuliridis]
MAGTALVLGGGGVTGIGWMTGVLHGLALAGTDPAAADLVIGTSAGAALGAQLAAGTHGIDALYEQQISGEEFEIPGRLRPGAILRYARALLTSRTPEEYGQKLGALALAAPTVPEEQRRAVIARRVGSDSWPARALAVTAVDAVTGELRIFDKDSGVPLVDAVAASSAVPVAWPPVTIEGRKWIDGGVYSPANVQLAAGYDRVVVISPTGSGNKVIAAPSAQAAALTAAGARVEVITPGSAARKAMGRNRLDPARRAPAARAGLAQAAAHAEAVAAVLAG